MMKGAGDFMKIEFICFALAITGAFLGLGLIIGTYTANDGALKECRKQHNVYECVMVAIPKNKERIYKGK